MPCVGAFWPFTKIRRFPQNETLRREFQFKNVDVKKLSLKKIELKMYFFRILSSISYIDCN